MATEDIHRAAQAETVSLRERQALWLARRALAVAAVTGDDPADLARSPLMLTDLEQRLGITPPARPELHPDRRFRARRPGFGDMPPPPKNSRMPARDWHRPGCVNWPQPGRSLCGTSAELAPLFAAVRRSS